MTSRASIGRLLRAGSALLPSGVIPRALIEQLRLEACTLAVGSALSDASTTRVHERSGWLLSDDQPTMPSAPLPPPIGAHPPADLYGATLQLEACTAPALVGVLRVLRGIGAAIESISALRLACPRAMLLREVHHGGCSSVGPPNPCWPDNGAEICCSLYLGRAGIPCGGAERARHAAVEVRVRGESQRVLVPPGGMLLSLARQVTCDIPPWTKAAADKPELWLTYVMYSTVLRSAADSRVLGIEIARDAQGSLCADPRGLGSRGFPKNRGRRTFLSP